MELRLGLWLSRPGESRCRVVIFTHLVKMLNIYLTNVVVQLLTFIGPACVFTLPTIYQYQALTRNISLK